MGEEDKELEKIKRSKFQELIKRISGREERTSKRDESLSAKDKPVVELTDSTFGEFVQGHPLAVIDCWAPWCGPCLIVSPIVEELARDYAGKIAFGKLNTDNNRSVPMRYGIMGIPTLLIFKNGKLVDRIVGAMPKHMMENMITRHL